ncbi:MAG TPA: hypothetical protein VM573_07225 [Actinomycetota bacterium]|nr:hypothetical protein [Actinomycetota bacterium]
MRWRTRHVLAVALIVGVTAVPAAHAADDKSSNITYEGTSPKNGTTNSDLAFWGNRAYAGNYDGFRIIDISNPRNIEDPSAVITDFRCPGPQNDISVWDNDDDPAADLLFLSVDSPRSDDSCNSTATRADNPDSWEGVRIFDINNEQNPVPIANVPTDCGSHTHTLVPGDDGNVYIYVSSYPLGATATTTTIPGSTEQTPARAAGTKNDGTECLEPEPGHPKPNGVHDKISIIRVPLTNPAAADDRVPAEGGTGWTYANVKEVALDGATYKTDRTSAGRHFTFAGCHDIAVYMAIDTAVGACWAEAHIWNISDPYSPKFLRRIRNDKIDSLFHSATFTYDGKYVALEDEAGGGGDDRCRDPNDEQGRMWLYDLSGILYSSFKIPRPQLPVNGEIQACTAHNYNFIPLNNGKYIVVSAWYEGGTSVINWTNVYNPREIAWFDADSPVNGTGPSIRSDVWSSYWYNGFIYVNDGLQRGDSNEERGLDVLSLRHRALSGEVELDFLNPQTQMELISQTRSVPSFVVLDYRRGAFRGFVFADDENCYANRTVRIRKAGGKTIARTTTNRFGDFRVSRPNASGRFFAVVEARTVPVGNDAVACGRDRSETVRVR